MPNRIISASFFIWILHRLVLAHERSHIMNTVHTHEDVNAIREKWGVDEIVRDLDHIRKDISKVIKMEDAGLITTSEAIFYFFKMYDFDNNERLDGLEYLVAISHSMEHMIEIEDVTHAIDVFLECDDNSDGFISYYEYKQHLKH
uniref:Multiple coagulation factor deficiency 2-like protein n=1 Tax=Cyriopagopus schmidti TaxID=29017 RepID=B5M6D0_CYRSC|nr:multiple coagulation factor deficiency 2-like protein [Cyriopagopus schmidti]